jgi:hypothetical protein
MNNCYVEIEDNQKVKVPKRRRERMNPLPEIEEDPINELMDIKAENTQRPEMQSVEKQNINLQALASQSEDPPLMS